MIVPKVCDGGEHFWIPIRDGRLEVCMHCGLKGRAPSFTVDFVFRSDIETEETQE